MFDRRADRAPRAGPRLLFPELRERLIELSYLAIGSPAKVALTRLPQIHSGDVFEAARRVEARGELVGERLVVDELVGAGRADRFLVQAFGIELAAFDPRDLGSHEGGAVLEVLRAIRRPDLELLVMSRDSVQVLLPVSRCRGIAGGSSRQRAVQVIFGRFEL